MIDNIFITGTDTNVGKTTYAVKLIEQLGSDNKKTLGLKPIACDSITSENNIPLSDTMKLKRASTIKVSDRVINPICFDQPLAPSILAEREGFDLSVKSLMDACNTALSIAADHLIVEGCGGWLYPLNRKETMADFARALNFPVILVVHCRLGCLNHALLTYRSILDSGCEIAGWVANTYQVESPVISENIETISDFFDLRPILCMI